MTTEKSKKKRMVKKSETVRQQRAKAADTKPKQRRVKQAASKANLPAKKAMQKVARIFKPFKFLIKPFRTRPARFTGRLLFKIFGIGYFINSWKELRQVQWPKRSETIKLTIAVFIFAFLVAAFIAILDFGLDKIFKQLLT